MSFLGGETEMASRIRAHDWPAHPFGPPDNWPASLRSALGICLNSAFPTAIYWGPELRLLYNDAWAPIPGPRHPECLGRPAQEVWSDIWHVIEPQFTRLIETGEGIFVEDQLLPMRRYGVEEETYWTYNFTPIRGDDGAIEGVFNSGNETTEHVLHRRQAEFLLALNDAFRACTDAEGARQVALEMLGRHLRADRSGLRARDPHGANEPLELVAEWAARGVPRLGRGSRLSRLGSEVERELAAGRVVRLDGVAEDMPDSTRAFLDEQGMASALAVPWTTGGRLDAVLFVHSGRVRTWSVMEVATVEKVLEQTMGWLERERTLAREKVMAREIDHRARNLLAIVNSIVRMTVAEEVPGFRRALIDRIAALAQTHSLLADRRWSGVPLGDLITEELAPFQGSAGVASDRLRITGPRVVLTPEQTQTVAMILHELATNAAKHGALRDAAGHVTVTWEAPSDGRLQIDWAEELAEALPDAPAAVRRGFGMQLLERLVEGQLAGQIDRDFGPRGLRCRLSVSLEGAGAHQAKPMQPVSGKRSILIVEDETLVAMDLAESVRELGYEVFEVAGSLDAGFAALANGTPSLALLDADLDGVSSQPIAELLVERGVPIIVASGYDPDSRRDGALLKHPRLPKPFSDALLAAKLTESLGSG